jgi:hypothetical protein
MIRLEGYGWYTSDGQTKQGPLAAAAVVQMVQSGTLEASHLIWKEGMPEWITAGSLPGLFGPPGSYVQSGPPPLPNAQKATSAAAAFDSLQNDRAGISLGKNQDFDPEGFLASEMTKAIIGKRSDFYIKRWTKLLEKTNGDYKKAATQALWMTAPLLIPFSWLFYRKMYVYGSVVFLADASIAALQALDIVPNYIGFLSYGISAFVCTLGPAWYFKHTYNIWKVMKENGTNFSLEKLTKVHGTSLAIGIISFVIYCTLTTLILIYGGVIPIDS